MNIGRNLNELRTDATNGLYQNLNYQTERITKKNLIIDTAFCSSEENPNEDFNEFKWHGGAAINFRTELGEKLIIDKLSEVYIDNISFYNLTADLTESTGTPPVTTHIYPIYLKINEFHTENYSNVPHMKGSTVLTEEWTNGKVYQSSKSKKMNYLTTINPMTIEGINFSISFYNDKLIMNSVFSNDVDKNPTGRAIIELVIVSKD